MKQAAKGAALSGLCYPGTGQMFFGRTYLGLGIISVSTIALAVLIYRIVIRIYRSIDPLLELLATNTLTFHKFKLVLSQTGYTGWDFEWVSLIVFVFCWMASTVHAYYLGLNAERSQKSDDSSQRLTPEK